MRIIACMIVGWSLFISMVSYEFFKVLSAKFDRPVAQICSETASPLQQYPGEHNYQRELK